MSRTISLQNILNYAHKVTRECGYDTADAYWSHAQGNNPFYEHLATMIWMKMTGRVARG